MKPRLFIDDSLRESVDDTRWTEDDQMERERDLREGERDAFINELLFGDDEPDDLKDVL